MSEPVEQTFITSQVPVDLKRELEAIAKRDDHPVSWVVRQALRRYVSDFHVEREAA